MPERCPGPYAEDVSDPDEVITLYNTAHDLSSINFHSKIRMFTINASSLRRNPTYAIYYVTVSYKLLVLKQ